MRKIALLIGHSEERQGAKNYLHETEFRFNSRVADRVAAIMANRNIQSFDNVDDLNDFNPTIVIELHFNWFKLPASGFEILVLDGDKISERFAKDMAKEFFDYYGTNPRHENGILRIEDLDRGYKNLKRIDAPVKVLFEPVFANFDTPEAVAFFDNEDKYVQFLIDIIDCYIKPSVTTVEAIAEIQKDLFFENISHDDLIAKFKDQGIMIKKLKVT